MQPDSELLLYFDPVMHLPVITDDRITRSFGNLAGIHQSNKPAPDLSRAIVVMAGIGKPAEADLIRSWLYGLSAMMDEGQVVDLGNYRKGKTPADTRAGLSDILCDLEKSGKIVLLLGGDMHSVAVFGEAYNRLEVPYNLAVVDSRIDIMDEENSGKSLYLNQLITDPESRLFDFAHLGYQTYLNDNVTIERLNELFFEHHRLGSLRDDPREAEPVFRNASMAAFSLSAVRQTEAPGILFPSANGFTGEEACQLARYAGLSDKLTLFSLLEFNPGLDRNGQTAALAAQICWFFLQGVSQRKSDYPFSDIKSYQKYIVNLSNSGHELVFYKSPLTNRWWIEVPYPDPKYPRSIYVACSSRDYQKACEGDIPDRWLNNYRRLT